MCMSFHRKSCPSFTLIPKENHFLSFERQLCLVLCHSECFLSTKYRFSRKETLGRQQKLGTLVCAVSDGADSEKSPEYENTCGVNKNLQTNEQQRF